jgi:hypothetical protein
MDLYTQSVGLFGRVVSTVSRRYLHGTTQKQKERGQTSMQRVRFEPTIVLSQWAKTFHA